MNQPLGNEASMAKVRELMGQQVSMGGNLTHTVLISYESEEGNMYTGQVVFKRPTVMDVMRMGGIKSQILADAGVNAQLVDNMILQVASIVATLKVVVVSAPPWLDYNNLHEIEVMTHVFRQFEVWEDSFRKPVPSKLDADRTTADGAEGLEASE